MRNAFVTLFDSNYLSRGLVLYESLLKHCNDFVLYIIAFDDECYEFLTGLKLDRVIVISLQEFEDEELLGVKDSRSKGEYCWTSTAKSVLYVFEKYNEKTCTYLDSDMMFFDDPSILINEMAEDESLIITPHNYSKEYSDYAGKFGIYNVSFMTFKNNKAAKDILKWWSDRCIEECSLDLSKGTCGDQKYLDDWLDRFKGVHVLENVGGGCAPWNASRYSLKNDFSIVKYDGKTISDARLVFWHFHALCFFDKRVVRLAPGDYYIPDTIIANVYKTYIREHEKLINKYKLNIEKNIYLQHFRDDADCLKNDRNFYLMDLFT